MKHCLFIAFIMSCLSLCSQSNDIAGEYEMKSTSVQYRLKLDPSGTFYFDSYNKFRQGLPAEPSISGRGTWRVENYIIYFESNPDTDIDHNFTLNFNDTKAKFISGTVKITAIETAISKLEFFESGIFWLNGIELTKRN